MSSQKRSRKLGFESLERKTAPSAALLGQPSLTQDRADQSSIAESADQASDVDADTNWRYKHSTLAVLEYVDVSVQESVSLPWTLPNQEQASQADRMIVRGVDSAY